MSQRSKCLPKLANQQQRLKRWMCIPAMIQKSCKTKKSYKKIEAEAHSINDPVNDEKPMTKKKKKSFLPK